MNGDMNQFNSIQPSQEQTFPAQPMEQSNPYDGLNMNGITSNTQVDYVATGSKLRKEHKWLKRFFIFIILLGLGYFGYFYAYPYINKNYLHPPIKTYNKAIDYFNEKANEIITDVVHDKELVDISFIFDSNKEDLKDYANTEYNLSFGIDPKNQIFEYGAYTGTGGNKVGADVYVANDNVYAKFSTYKDLLALGKLYEVKNVNNIDKIYQDYHKMLNQVKYLNKEDCTYVVDLITKLVKDTIKEDRLVLEDATIKVNDKELKVYANKYSLNEDLYKETVNYIIDNLVKDEKAMDIISSFKQITKVELINRLNDKKIDDKKLVNYKGFDIVIYTTHNGDIHGYDINYDGKEIKYYFNKNNFYFNLITDGKDGKDTYNAIGIADGNYVNFSVKLNGVEIASGVIREYTKTKIDMDYEYIKDNNKYRGSLKYSATLTNEKNTYDIEYNIESKNDYIKAKLILVEYWDIDIPSININTADQVSDQELENIMNNFANAFENNPIHKYFTTLSDDPYFNFNQNYDDY